ncbi:DUF2264 domain-containing protein [Isoptericola sp. NPDC057653]|uniref:DUF2264 domain-containing protein n=1 Tax=Isoptericola sp. NPDC057653 TaxID=3346195 RepID=UPI00369FD6C3
MGPFVLPPDDRALSPVTGWTRDHWVATGHRWLDQVRRFSSPLGAATRLPGRVTGDGARRESMEAVGRSFLLAAPLVAGTSGPRSDDVLEWYARALLAGTDPDGPEAWPLGVTCRAPITGVTNNIVEAANLAFGLHVSRDRLWAGLTRPEQRQVAAWLRHHARLEVWHNNWQLFPAMAEGFLRSVGEDTSGCTGERNVARVESWYLEQGWYTDGPEHAIDHYNAWAIHPYLWAWYEMTGRTDAPEGRRHRERLHAFSASFADLVAPDGSLLHVGRSLTYRTAALAAVWCAELAGASALTPGQTRALTSGVLRRFVDDGVGVDAPLDLGWRRPHEPIAQTYSGFGSSYLAGIGFLGLALPDEAPVWTDREEPHAPRPRTIAAAGWIVRPQSDGIVRLVNHGSDHCEIPVEPTRPDPDDPHYAKLGYSTHTAPGTGPAWDEGVDGHLALVGDDGRASRRGVLRAMRAEGPVAASAHVPQRDGVPFPGVTVVSATIVEGDLELRAHLVRSDRAWPVREGGWQVAGDTAPRGTSAGLAAAVTNADGLTGAVVGLAGWASSSLVASTGSDAFGPASAVPVLHGSVGAGDTVLVSLHALSARPRPLEGAVTVAVSGTTVTARWGTGAEQEVDLATWLWPVLPA